MALRIGRSSLSRSLMSAARASPPLPRARPSSSAAPRLQSRRFSFAAPSRYLKSEWVNPNK